jgi:hypothetical protein
MERTCSYCNNAALYDAPTINGPWAYFCYAHYLVNANIDFPPTLLKDIKE